MALVFEVAAGVLLGGLALIVFANWPREVLGIVGFFVLAAGALLALLIDPYSLVLFIVGGIVWVLWKRYSERRAQLEEQEAAREASARHQAWEAAQGPSWRDRAVNRLAELETKRQAGELNLGEHCEYDRLTQIFTEGHRNQAGT